MAGSLFWLSDAAWAAIEPHLPKNQPGARRVDNRRVISGIVRMLKCGGRWADCPSEYDPSTTIYNRWNRSSRRGVNCILAALTEEGWMAETGQIDRSYVKAHRCSGGAKRGDPITRKRVKVFRLVRRVDRFSEMERIMRALCWHGKGDVRVDTVADPEIKHPRDAIIKVTACARYPISPA